MRLRNSAGSPSSEAFGGFSLLPMEAGDGCFCCDMSEWQAHINVEKTH